MNSHVEDSFRLPYPGWCRNARGRQVGFFVLLLAFFIAAGSVFYALAVFDPPFPFHWIGLSIAFLLAFGALLPVFYSRPITISRSQGTIRGFPNGKEIPVNKGELLVRRTTHIHGSGKYQEDVDCYQLRYKRGKSTILLFDWEEDPLKARAFAEALAILGDYPLTWIQGLGKERRLPDELDLPITEILRRNPPPTLQPRYPLTCVKLEERPGELQIHWQGVPRIPLARGLSITLGGAALTGFGAFLKEDFSFALVVTLGALVVLFPFGLGSWVFAKSVQFSVRVTPKAFQETRNILGLHTLVREIPADQVESIYIEGNAESAHLLLASDTKFSTLGTFLGKDAPVVLTAIQQTLIGRSLHDSSDDPFPHPDHVTPPNAATLEVEDSDVPW